MLACLIKQIGSFGIDDILVFDEHALSIMVVIITLQTAFGKARLFHRSVGRNGNRTEYLY